MFFVAAELLVIQRLQTILLKMLRFYALQKILFERYFNIFTSVN